MAKTYWLGTTSNVPTLAANWLGAAVPSAGDDVYVQLIAGLTQNGIGAADQHTLVLNSLTINADFLATFPIGAAGSGGYWQIGTATATIGAPASDGSTAGGSGRCKLDFGTGALTVNVLATPGSSSDAGVPPVQLLMVNSANVVNVLSGRVGIATNVPGEVSTLGTINVTGNTANCIMGDGVTWTTGDASSGGKFTSNSGGTNLNVASRSTATINGSTIVTTITNSGTLNHNVRAASGASTTTLTNIAGGICDFSGNPSAGTITTMKIEAGSITRLNGANPGHITFTTRTLVNVQSETYG